MDVVNAFCALRAEQKNTEAVEMLADDAVFATPKVTATGKAEIFKLIESKKKDKPPEWLDEFVEESPGVFSRNGKAKMMMIAISVKQIITVVDGKIVRVELQKK